MNLKHNFLELVKDCFYIFFRFGYKLKKSMSKLNKPNLVLINVVM